MRQQQPFARVENQPGETADERSVQAYVLKIAADIQLDDVDHLVDVPGSNLIGDKTRDFAQKFKARHGDIPTAQHAGQYSAVMNYLNAVAAIGVDEAKKSGRAVLKQMRATKFDDPLFGALSVREDGRVLHQMLALQVKAPAQSTSKDDVYNVVAVIPPEQAFRPLAEGNCPLIAK